VSTLTQCHTSTGSHYQNDLSVWLMTPVFCGSVHCNCTESAFECSILQRLRAVCHHPAPFSCVFAAWFHSIDFCEKLTLRKRHFYSTKIYQHVICREAGSPWHPSRRVHCPNPHPSIPQSVVVVPGQSRTTAPKQTEPEKADSPLLAGTRATRSAVAAAASRPPLTSSLHIHPALRDPRRLCTVSWWRQ